MTILTTKKLTTSLQLILVALLVSGCGGSSSSGSRNTPTPSPAPEPEAVVVNGSVMDGPVSGGTLFVFPPEGINDVLEAANEAADRLASLEGAGAIVSSTLPASEDGSYTIEVPGDQAGNTVFLVFDGTDAEDLTFGDEPFDMESVAELGDGGSEVRANITPQTTMLAQQVRLVDESAATATQNVISAVGEDQLGNEVIEEGTDLVGTDDEDALEEMASTLGAFIRSTAAATDSDTDEVLLALALDSLDGVIDGNIPASAEVDEELLELAGEISVFATIGASDEPFGIGSCSTTADLLRRACEIDIMDDFLEGAATCQDGTEGELEECTEELAEEQEETLEECAEVFDARLTLCDLLGDAVYEPDFGEDYAGNFVDPTEIGDTVAVNPWFPLVEGNTWVYEATIDDDGEEITETTTVIVRSETKLIEGVTCVVVNDIVEEDGQLIEDTDDWFAQDIDGNVWYCGEISKNFEYFDGDEPEEMELVDIEGSWKAGRDGGKAGILVPINPQVGDVLRNEVLYGEAEDVIEVLSLTGDEATEAASCDGACYVAREFTPLEPEDNEETYYKAGIGVILEVDTEAEERNELISFTPGG